MDASRPAVAAPAQLAKGVLRRLARGLEGGGKNWTGARKKDNLQRVLDSSHRDAQRMQQRLGQLIIVWEKDQPGAEVDALSADSEALASPAPAVVAVAVAASAVARPVQASRALKNLAARVTEWLRPIDHVARFGGEEFRADEGLYEAKRSGKNRTCVA